MAAGYVWAGEIKHAKHFGCTAVKGAYDHRIEEHGRHIIALLLTVSWNGTIFDEFIRFTERQDGRRRHVSWQNEALPTWRRISWANPRKSSIPDHTNSHICQSNLAHFAKPCSSSHGSCC